MVVKYKVNMFPKILSVLKKISSNRTYWQSL